MQNKLAIVGLGYVGLPLSLQFCRKGNHVVGLDIDQAKVDRLNLGESFIHHIPSASVAEEVSAGRFLASTDFSSVSRCRAVVICVPTPLNKNREPDISYIIATGKAIAPYLRKGMLVVLESTTYPGTTDEDLRDVLEEGSGLHAGTDLHLAFSPEREDPGLALNTVVPVSSCRAAEATKLLENIFRGVNIALVNELKVVYDSMGIDIWEVIEAAKTKPFGFMPFYPGPGLGGHCIPIDPFYLTWKAREYGLSTRFIELAGEVNTSMPDYVIQRLSEALNAKGMAMKGRRILLVGLAYKANVDDDRESPGYVLMDKMSKLGVLVSYYDPYIPVIRPSRAHGHWAGVKSVAWSKEVIGSFDAVLISTAHANVDYAELGQWANLIVDTRNAMKGIASRSKVVKA